MQDMEYHSHSGHSGHAGEHKREKKEKASYGPLITLTIISILMTWALSIGQEFNYYMINFMGIALSMLAMVKFFDLEGFKKMYHKYDLLAMKVPSYGYIYPFIELFLGIGLLTGICIRTFAILTFLIMGFGAVGVLNAIKHKKDLFCGCMGSSLKVPLSVVSLSEDLLMVAMSFVIANFGMI